MAWIVKDVAHQKIARRSEPYLTDALKSRLESEVMSCYPTRQAALLPVVHAIQDEHGWVTPQALEEVADFLKLTQAEVLDAVTFYEEFHLHPKGVHLVQVCRSISCEFCGQLDISRRLQAKWSILPGETTDDGRFTLMEIECLGTCEVAPAVLVDGRLHGNLTWKKLEAILDGLAD